MRLSVIIAFLVSASATPAAEPFRFDEPVQPPRRVQVVANRGLRMLAPENSIEAVRECASDFIEWAAIDVRRTADGHHVVLDEDTLVTVDRKGQRVSALTLVQVRELQTGAAFAKRFSYLHPSTLMRMFDEAGRFTNLILRCEGADAALLVREIRELKLQSRVLIAGPPEFLAQVHTAADDVAMLVQWRPAEASLDQLLATGRPAAVELAAADVTPERCRELQSQGIRVLANILGRETDNSEIWTRLFEADVDLILTDHPAEVRFAEVRRRIPQFPVMIACHRGANRYAPENTLPAITLAATLGADFIEIDIRTTQDGQFVLVHDGKLDRTTNGKGPVKEQTAAAIAALDAGSWFGAPFAGLKVPTFDEGLQALGRHSQAYLDAKDIAPEALLAAIRRHSLMERHAVYASPEYCRRLKELEPAVRLMPPLRVPEDLPKVAELHPYCVDANWSKLSKDVIDRCHAAGIKVFSDALGPHETLDDYSQAMDWGIDLIQTDYPLRVLRAIELRAP